MRGAGSRAAMAPTRACFAPSRRRCSVAAGSPIVPCVSHLLCGSYARQCGRRTRPDQGGARRPQHRRVRLTSRWRRGGEVRYRPCDLGARSRSSGVAILRDAVASTRTLFKISVTRLENMPASLRQRVLAQGRTIFECPYAEVSRWRLMNLAASLRPHPEPAAQRCRRRMGRCTSHRRCGWPAPCVLRTSPAGLLSMRRNERSAGELMMP